jgi:tellurite resistance protein TerB
MTGQSAKQAQLIKLTTNQTRSNPMSFETFLSQLKSKANELKTEALKFKNKEFLNAAMAGSALIAMADGNISSEEKQKMIKFIESNDALSIFSTSDVIKAFQDFVGQLEFDKDIGEAKAYEALGKMKSNAQAARLLVRMIIAIASSDGNFDASEKKIANKIAKELAIDPQEFELG